MRAASVIIIDRVQQDRSNLSSAFPPSNGRSTLGAGNHYDPRTGEVLEMLDMHHGVKPRVAAATGGRNTGKYPPAAGPPMLS